MEGPAGTCKWDLEARLGAPARSRGDFESASGALGASREAPQALTLSAQAVKADTVISDLENDVSFQLVEYDLDRSGSRMTRGVRDELLAGKQEISALSGVEREVVGQRGDEL